MSLDFHPKGNPRWTKGQSGNPAGRPKGGKALKTVLKVAATLSGLKRHPVEELVRIADKVEKAANSLVITKPGATSYKVGEIVSKIDFETAKAMVKGDNKPEAKPLPGGDNELAAKIWSDLLQYCEPKKKAQEVAPEKPLTPEESKENAEKLLEEMERIADGQSNTSTESSGQAGLGDGEAQVEAEANSENDLRPDQGE